uniref:Uncharacterized protein n=1 Tax=Trypanosoma vivax (strain Y486) TaxID=1055687 RepID=G0TZ43_TRYVY|nr:hypothetical protein, unlikely [Trypanosoma vivax Y486]
MKWPFKSNPPLPSPLAHKICTNICTDEVLGIRRKPNSDKNWHSENPDIRQLKRFEGCGGDVAPIYAYRNNQKSSSHLLRRSPWGVDSLTYRSLFPIASSSSSSPLSSSLFLPIPLVSLSSLFPKLPLYYYYHYFCPQR